MAVQVARNSLVCSDRWYLVPGGAWWTPLGNTQELDGNANDLVHHSIHNSTMSYGEELARHASSPKD
jgi:hypothetical protein